MKNDITYYALTEMIFTICIGVILLYITYKIIDKYIRIKHKIEITNVSYSIFLSSIIFSVGYLISDIKTPILNSLRIIQEQPEYSGDFLIDGLKYTTLFLTIIIASIFLINIISIYLFAVMTKTIDEFKEIKQNNIAVAILMAVIIISISIMVKGSLYFLLDTFVPYPEIPKFE